MSESIRIEHLTKRYELGAMRHETMLREALLNLFRRGPRLNRPLILPFRNSPPPLLNNRQNVAEKFCGQTVVCARNARAKRLSFSNRAP